MFVLNNITDALIKRITSLGMQLGYGDGGDVIVDTDIISIPLARAIFDAWETILPGDSDELIIEFAQDKEFVHELARRLHFASAPGQPARLYTVGKRGYLVAGWLTRACLDLFIRYRKRMRIIPSLPKGAVRVS